MSAKFAFGNNYVSGCCCPALSIGLTSPGSTVAGCYDILARRATGGADEGVIVEAKAREYWIDAIKFSARNFWSKEQVATSIFIATKLGWLGKSWGMKREQQSTSLPGF